MSSLSPHGKCCERFLCFLRFLHDRNRNSRACFSTAMYISFALSTNLRYPSSGSETDFSFSLMDVSRQVISLCTISSFAASLCALGLLDTILRVLRSASGCGRQCGDVSEGAFRRRQGDVYEGRDAREIVCVQEGDRPRRARHTPALFAVRGLRRERESVVRKGRHCILKCSACLHLPQQRSIRQIHYATQRT